MKNRIAAIIGIIILPGFVLFNSCSSPEEITVPRSHIVEIRAMQFHPSELSVQKGDTVVFINNDMVVHDVTEENSKSWGSSPLSTGQSFSLVVTASADYYCTIHPVMKGHIIAK